MKWKSNNGEVTQVRSYSLPAYHISERFEQHHPESGVAFLQHWQLVFDH